MDGNGRWAKRRFLSRIKGHEKGSRSVRAVVQTSRELGIPYLTLFAFSTENWRRPKSEIDALMNLLKKFLVSEQQEMLEKGIRLFVIGELDRLPSDVQNALRRCMEITGGNHDLQLNLALSYGGRAEIVRMAQQLAREAAAGRIEPQSITSETVSQYLYTDGIPDPDLLIRTSGEMRISNFLLWQIAYTELYVTPTLWPDFSREEFLNILRDYQKRERRFGNVDARPAPDRF
jgi:undecaprenyl diphosphate synthase